MRYVIANSFDQSEVNRYFESEVPPRIGGTVRSKAGKVYRIQDICWYTDSFDHGKTVRVLVSRER